MEAERKVLLLEIERVLDSNPGIRVGELLSKAVKPNEDLHYIDDKDLALRVHQIGETIGARTKEEITNKKIYDIAHANTTYNSEGKVVISSDDEWLAETEWDEMYDSIVNRNLEYKGYHAQIRFDKESKVFRGVISGIKDYIDFETEDASKVEIEFQSAVDDYIKFCNEVGKQPETDSTEEENFNEETIAAKNEVEEMIKNPSKHKTYSTAEEALADALSEEE